MENLETTYKSLISRENLIGLTDEESLRHIGRLTDISLDIQKIEGLKHAIKLSEELQERSLSPGQLATSHYFLANAWARLKLLLIKDKDCSLDWEQEETEEELIHLRRAFNEEGLIELSNERACQILTNLGNIMRYVGRFVEAIVYWDRALAKIPSFPMARGNRGLGLTHYAHALYDKGHAEIFLKHAHADLKNALLFPSLLHEDAQKGFSRYRDRIESVLSQKHLNTDLDMHTFSLGTSEQEIRYRRWCLENRLFLNPLNDLGLYPISARDILTTPSVVVKSGEGPYYLSYFDQMKQEFVSARYLYYEGTNEKLAHFSDREVFLYNTLDYPSYSLSVEKVKAAFRMVYSLFDKIAYFLNHYMVLSIPETKVTFRTFWYKSQKKKEGLRHNFQKSKNWPLRGLFWLSKDLYENKPGFKDCIEPEAKELSGIRNYLEHKYLKLHEGLWSGHSSNKVEAIWHDNVTFSMHRREFEAKTLRLIKMARAALIYLSLSIHYEEQRRLTEQHSKSIIPEIQLDVWEDEWKVRM